MSRKQSAKQAQRENMMVQGMGIHQRRQAMNNPMPSRDANKARFEARKVKGSSLRNP